MTKQEFNLLWRERLELKAIISASQKRIKELEDHMERINPSRLLELQEQE